MSRYTYSMNFQPQERKRLDEAFEKLSDMGCVKSRRELFLKTGYFILLFEDTDKLCEIFGQSLFTLEKKLEKGVKE